MTTDNNESVNKGFHTTLLLDHHSVIQNPVIQEFEDEFTDLEVTSFTKAEFIVREHNGKDIQKLLDNGFEPGELEYFDIHKGPKAITDKFLTYMETCSANRKFLAASLRNGQGEKHIFWEALNRYQSNRNVKPISELLEILSLYNIPSIMLTLTYDPGNRSQRESWELVSKDFNRFLTRLKIEIAKERGISVKDLQLPYIRVLEAQHDLNGKNYGYAHVHVLFFGVDYLYWNGNHEEYEFVKTGRPIRKSIESFWKLGYTSVNKTASGQNILNPVNYLMKYIRKTWESWNDEAVLTKAMLWAFNKRTFDVSRKFGDYVKSVVQGHVNDQTVYELVRLYPQIIEMPEISSILDDLPEFEQTYLRNLSEIYGKHRHPPVPDSAIDEFTTIAKLPNTTELLEHVKHLTTKPESIAELLGMIKAFKPDHERVPFSKRHTMTIQITHRQSTNDDSANVELDKYTMDDLEFLAEKSAMMRSSRDEEKALKFLMSAYNKGHMDYVYYAMPKSDLALLYKSYRDKKRYERQSV